MSGALLVVAHEATRTGAPRALIELLRAVQPKLAVPIAVRMVTEGPLSDELWSLCSADPGVEPVAIVVNGSQAAATINEYPEHVPAILYVHEEGEALALLPEADRRAIRDRYDLVICVSQRSRDDLIEMGANEHTIRMMPPPVREPAAGSGRTEQVGPTQDRDLPLVIGCGTAAWRKGPDLFIDVARRVNAVQATRFAWAGRRPRGFARLLDTDTVAAGLTDRVRWLGELPDLEDLYRSADLVLMTSREDPQPLVPLEAALLGLATVGFEVGGLSDLSRSGAAATVPFPDTAALAALVLDVLADGKRRQRMTEHAAALARGRSPHHTALQLLEDLRSLAPGVAA